MGNITVIGPTGSGKTTYLAALAYSPPAQSRNSRNKKYKIEPQNPESRELAGKAEVIICQGLALEKTRINEGDRQKTVDDLPFYAFGIELKKNLLSKSTKINLTARDYPGEIFEGLVNSGLSDSISQTFIEECFVDADGCLILLTGWEKGVDNFYYRVMQRFIEQMDTHERSQDFKLAVAMSKCERGEIWSGRLDPELDLFSIHLPRTRDILREKISKNNLKFFAISTFGVLGKNDPRPNRIDTVRKGEPESVLREIPRWRPYNLIDPLDWLSKKPK